MKKSDIDKLKKVDSNEYRGKTCTLPGCNTLDNKEFYFTINKVIFPYNCAMAIILDSKNNYYVSGILDLLKGIEKGEGVSVINSPKIVITSNED